MFFSRLGKPKRLEPTFGIGIPQADLPHVFDRFYKSSDSGGMGLGLSIAKYLVEAHSGKIWAESEVGMGTKITFSFPAL